MEKRKNIIIGLLLFIIVILVVVIILFTTDSFKFNSNNTCDTTNINNDKNNNSTINNNEVEYKNYEEKLTVGEGEYKETYTIKYTFTKNENYVSEVPIEDTYTIHFEPTFGKNIYLLRNKQIYYYSDKCYNDYCNVSDYDFSEDGEQLKLTLYNNINNVYRIKSINYGTGLDYSVLAITDEGKVYFIYKNDIKPEQINEEFNKYSVDDILSYDYSIPTGGSWKVVLKDGTIMEKSIEEK